MAAGRNQEQAANSRKLANLEKGLLAPRRFWKSWRMAGRLGGWYVGCDYKVVEVGRDGIPGKVKRANNVSLIILTKHTIHSPNLQEND